jgi:hypothetical protein
MIEFNTRHEDESGGQGVFVIGAHSHLSKFRIRTRSDYLKLSIVQ